MTRVIPKLEVSPSGAPARLTCVPFPPYRFIPSLTPHPVRDPAGHSYGQSEGELTYLAPEEYRQNSSYLYGADLYNHAFWWESHEQWERVWHTTNKHAPEGQFLQGLIQISAAFIKWYLHQPEGMIKLYDLGIGRLEYVCASHPLFMGVDLEKHVEQLRLHFASVIAAATDSVGGTRNMENWPNPLKNYPFLIVAECAII